MTRLYRQTTVVFGLVLFFLSGCDLGPLKVDESADRPFAEQEVPDGFDYSTTKNVSFNLLTKNNINEPVSGVLLSVYNVKDDGSRVELFSGLSDSYGEFSREYRMETSSEKISVVTSYAGFPNRIDMSLDGPSLLLDYRKLEAEPVTSMFAGKGSVLSGLSFLGDYNTHGKPFYLITPEEPISQDFMADVNASLPEGVSVPEFRPDYLASGAQINTLLNEAADVFVTFFHEGTEKNNTLGYYTYQAGNKPQSVDEIDSITIVFPNASYSGSGGNLHSGNKVNIGFFPANTEIGWVLLADGWNRSVSLGEAQYYSNPVLNPETDESVRQHNVLLYDDIRDVTVLGFEDTDRESGSDNDFNDILFYVTSNPSSAISGTDVITITYTGDDSDGDGIADLIDIYPNDPDKAYANYFPAKNTFGSLAFEDLWPYVGDYDFNDLVIDYYFIEIMNGSNEVVEIESKFVIKATGASFENGFGFELPVPQSSVTSISGMQLTDNYINLDEKGLESGQSNAVAIVFDNVYNIVNSIPGYYLNTQTGVPYVSPDTVTIVTTLSAPVNPSVLGAPPYNPFMIVDRDRSREVHLPGMPPTTLAASSELFNSGNDASASSGYYKTSNNLPWALDIVEPLAYPIEKNPIDAAHIYFVEWATNGGSRYPDWYKDKTGYRNIEKIYAP